MALDGRGGLVATGIGGDPTTLIDVGVLRYAMDGTRDEGFGVDGLAPSPFTPGEAMGFGMDIGVGPGGSITVAGQLVTPSGEIGHTDDMGAIRYTPGSVLTSTSTTTSSSSTTTTSVPFPSSTTTTAHSATTSTTLPATPPTTTLEAPSPDSFSDDDGSTFEDDIEWLAASGITSGCNPPLNDLFCPDAAVTRGQMAAFLVRALGLTSLGSFEFIDDDASVFESDIEKLAEAGVTRGCNPPANTLFCPDGVVTRGQMAAFLHRAWPDLPLVAGSVDFDDVAGSVFGSDIEWLARTGVTRGCSETSFCPEAPVTRGQMAAFLRRALSS
jgi:hypothetical protein